MIKTFYTVHKKPDNIYFIQEHKAENPEGMKAILIGFLKDFENNGYIGHCYTREDAETLIQCLTGDYFKK